MICGGRGYNGWNNMEMIYNGYNMDEEYIG
jgi:hypothetical protein